MRTLFEDTFVKYLYLHTHIHTHKQTCILHVMILHIESIKYVFSITLRCVASQQTNAGKKLINLKITLLRNK